MSITFDAELKNVQTYFSMPDGEKSLQIPVYQRRYEWEEDHCVSLFEDLIGHIDENGINIENLLNPSTLAKKYLLGSVILLKDGNGDRFLIDGQQRTTTLTLLASALHTRLQEVNIENIDRPDAAQRRQTALDWIRPIFRRTMAFAFAPVANLQVNYGVAAYESIVLSGVKVDIPALDITSIKYNKIYDLFLKLIDEKLDLEGDDFRKRFDKLIIIISAAIHNLVLLVVIAKSPLTGDSAHDEAIGIFSTLNTRGLDLAPSDKIKASLFSHINNVQDAIREWDQRFENSSSDDIDAYCVSLIFSINRDYPKSAMNSWMTLLGDLGHGLQGQEFWIQKFLKPYDFYSKKINDNTSVASSLISLPFGEWRAPLLSFHNDPNPDDFIKKLHKVCFCFCITGAYEKTRKSYLRKIFWNQGDIDYSYENLASQAITKLSDLDVYLLPSPKRNFLLRAISSILLGGQIILGGEDHIEHVLPQSYDRWIDVDGWTTDDAQKWLHKIGNLIFLPAKINAQISNRTYRQKIEAINEKMTELNLISAVNAHGLRLALINLAPSDIWSPEIVSIRQNYIVDSVNNWLRS